LPTSPGHRDRTDSPEVSPPFSVSTRGAPGHSDLAALVPWTRLPPPSGSAFRFFQPLDGLRRPRASRPYFVPLTLWDLLFRAFPCQKAAPLSGPLLPCGWAVTDLHTPSDPAASRPSPRQPFLPLLGASLERDTPSRPGPADSTSNQSGAPPVSHPTRRFAEAPHRDPTLDPLR